MFVSGSGNSATCNRTDSPAVNVETFNVYRGVEMGEGDGCAEVAVVDMIESFARLCTCVYNRYHYEASDPEMLTLWTHLVSAESAASEELQQVQVTILESAEAEASKEVSGRARCVTTERSLTIQPTKEAKWLRKL